MANDVTSTPDAQADQDLQRRIEALELELKTARATIHRLHVRPAVAVPVAAEGEEPAPSRDLSALEQYTPGAGLDAGLFREFARQWLHRVDDSYFQRRSMGEVLAQLEATFRFIQQREAGEIKVRVFTPTEETHGYALSCTVVETCMADQPFILDTLRMLFQERELMERACLHPILDVIRDNGRVTWISNRPSPSGDSVKESMMHWELEAVLTGEQQESLRVEATRRLQMALAVVRDFRRMVRRVTNLASELGLSAEELPRLAPELDEVSALLHWLRHDKFVFMSYERFDLRETAEGLEVVSDPRTRLGLRSIEEPRGLPEASRQWLSSNAILFVGKKIRESMVHRPGKLDVLLVKSLDEHGRPVQVHLFSGLFTRKALSEQGGSIPVLREKLKELLKEEDIVQDSYLQRAIVIAFNSMPVEYLFGAEVGDLRQVIRQILSAEVQRETSAFYRVDPLASSAFVLVSIPRDRYSNELKERISDQMKGVFGATYEDDREVFGQNENVLVYYYLTAQGRLNHVDETLLRSQLHALTRTWEESLRLTLPTQFPEEEARALANRYAVAFPDEYRVRTTPAEAARDIAMFQELERTGQMQFRIAPPEEGGQGYVLRVYEPKLTPLTYTLPILSYLGFEVASEVAVELDLEDGKQLFLNIFQVAPNTRLAYDLLEREARIGAALAAVFAERMENDRLNQLVLLGDVDWRLVDMLRAYIHYNRQLVSQSPLDFSRQVCLTHHDASRLLTELFEARFNPDLELPQGVTRQARIDELRETFLDRLRSVEISSEDKVLRNLFTLIEATVRTNFYQDRPYLSFKFDPSKIDHMADPRPYREIYVHHPEVEGVHLRGGPIARGGLRWSDRYDDFRKEVLGLMTTQQVKNVVIVPVGSKGGFILKKRYTDRKLERREADRLYQVFIQGLLDVTDNIVDGKVIPPERVVRWDADDPYLVVAADKGTAHLSDTANKISLARRFWLGDAFASGGSNGYDHKALAITSRGAWESVKRHFLEMGPHPEKDVITCVGIGDMSGDVFGNGLLRSRTIKLIGAFNHMHIFLDPTPDPEKSFRERDRMFKLPGSTWDDYDKGVISEGGGVYKRTAKAIELTPQVKALLGVQADTLSGEEVIHRLMQLEVDLLWNGGIGTYVKASHETHIDVGDRVNDAVRVDARELKAKVVAEGGNLGFTQAARIEYAALGGRIDTDAVDNSGGVDCSDHEVNLKILFEPLCRREEMSYEQRNEQLERLSDEVCDLVLVDNYSQNLLLSLDERRSRAHLQSFIRLIEFLEREAGLNRAFEGLPTNTELHERRSQGKGLYRPELSKVMAYTKMYVYGKLLADPRFQGIRVDQALRLYFPKEVVAKYEKYLPEHPLRKEIAATYLTNRIVDAAGATFFYNVWEDVSYEVTQVAFGYLLVSELLNAPRLKADILALEGKLSAEVLYQALLQIEDTLAMLTRRVIRRNFDVYAPDGVLEKLKADFESLRRDLPVVVSPETRAEGEKKVEGYLQAGLPEALASEVAWFSELVSGGDIALLKTDSGFDLKSCTWLYHRVGQDIGLRRALARASSDGAEGPDWWNKSALSLLRAKLIDLQYQVSLQIARRTDKSAGIEGLAASLEAFKQERAGLLERVRAFERRLQKTPAGAGVSPMVVLASMLEELVQG